MTTQRKDEMIFKKLRYWLASKILGGLIVEESKFEEKIEAAKHEFIKEQLAMGNIVSIEFKVVETGHIYERKAANG